jgi:hypothetical protein
VHYNTLQPNRPIALIQVHFLPTVHLLLNYQISHGKPLLQSIQTTIRLAFLYFLQFLQSDGSTALKIHLQEYIVDAAILGEVSAPG